jgi:hypothetical protein
MLIATVGKARTGKDTFAEMLAEELFDITQTKFTLMAYATEIKLRVQRDFDLSYDQLWGDQKEVEDKRYPKPNSSAFWTGREILQSYGQFFRMIDSDFWVNNLFNVIDEKEYSNVIITDVRHPNEAGPVKERGGYVIRVTSDRENKQNIHGAQHISETAMDDYEDIDFTVVNNQGLSELRVVAKNISRFLIKMV